MVNSALSKASFAPRRSRGYNCGEIAGQLRDAARYECARRSSAIGNRARRTATLWLSLLLLLSFVAAARPAVADEAGEVWLVSTRGRRSAATWRRAGRRSSIGGWARTIAWQAADAAAFHQGDGPGTPTTIFIHGNRIEPDEAVEEALVSLPAHAAGGRRPALSPGDLVVAQRGRGAGRPRDVLVKLDFSDAQSYYLARFLGDLRADVPVSLIGYSLGARAATGALVLLAGGSIADRCLPAAVVARQAQDHPRPLPRPAGGRGLRRRLAPARPSRRPGVGLVQRMLVMANPCDRVLKHYPKLYGRGGPEAMGPSAAYCDPQPGGCDKIETLDVACSVGPPHDWYRYMACRSCSDVWAGTPSWKRRRGDKASRRLSASG